MVDVRKSIQRVDAQLNGRILNGKSLNLISFRTLMIFSNSTTLKASVLEVIIGHNNICSSDFRMVKSRTDIG